MLGGLWYSPVLFANKWAALTGLSEEKLKSGSMAMIFGGAFLLNLIAAFVLAMFRPRRRSQFATLAGPPSACVGSRPASASPICSNAARSACG